MALSVLLNCGTMIDYFVSAFLTEQLCGQLLLAE